MTITEVNITPVKPSNGLVAFASIVVDGSLYLNGIAVLVKLDGTYRLLFPTKKTGERTINIFHPINREASAAIEHAVFKKCSELFDVRHFDTGTGTAPTI